MTASAGIWVWLQRDGAEKEFWHGARLVPAARTERVAGGLNRELGYA